LPKRLRLFKLLTWYKELQEEQAKLRIYHARVNLEKLLQEKRLLEEEYEESLQHLKAKRAFSAEELRGWLNYFEVLKEFREISEKKVKTQEEHLESLKNELIKINREKRLMERLHEKALFRVNLEEAKKFFKDLDDLVLLRRGRGLA